MVKTFVVVSVVGIMATASTYLFYVYTNSDNNADCVPSDMNVSIVSGNEAEVTWTMSGECSYYVKYGFDQNDRNMFAPASKDFESYKAVLTSLPAGQAVYFTVVVNGIEYGTDGLASTFIMTY
jgi:hypothetical protein